MSLFYCICIYSSYIYVFICFRFDIFIYDTSSNTLHILGCRTLQEHHVKSMEIKHYLPKKPHLKEDTNESIKIPQQGIN